MSVGEVVNILQDYVYIACNQFQYIRIHATKDSPTQIQDTITGKTWTLPVPFQTIAPHSRTQITFYKQDPQIWPNFIAIKKISKTTYVDIVKEASLTKMFGDMGIGTPCNMTPTDSRNFQIFAGIDPDQQSAYIIMNRMSMDAFDMMYDDPNLLPYMEQNLGPKIDELVNLGFLFTDIKLENTFAITENDARIQNNAHKQLTGSEENIYPPGPSFYLADFDLSYACNTFVGDAADYIFRGLEGQSLFRIPTAVPDPQRDPYHTIYKGCMSLTDHYTANAYKTIIKGMLGGYFNSAMENQGIFNISVFKNETFELFKLIDNLRIISEPYSITKAAAAAGLTTDQTIELKVILSRFLKSINTLKLSQEAKVYGRNEVCKALLRGMDQERAFELGKEIASNFDDNSKTEEGRNILIKNKLKNIPIEQISPLIHYSAPFSTRLPWYASQFSKYREAHVDKNQMMQTYHDAYIPIQYAQEIDEGMSELPEATEYILL